MRARYLVCYDIADSGRLGRVFRYVKGQGIHLQYSVFVCSLTWPELQEMKRCLAELIDAQTDDVRFYPLPSGNMIEALGLADRTPDGSVVEIP